MRAIARAGRATVSPTGAPGPSTTEEVLPLRRVFVLWLPLAVSFVMMTLEGPALQSAIGRLADPKLNLAAWGLTLGLSMLIESPVIMLLATSIALVSDFNAFRSLRRFTVSLCLGCTALTAIVAFTPVYDFITRTLMHQPEAIRLAARPGLAIMLAWSAAIGWRRFYQGVMVRHGSARKVSWGTAIRLTSVVTTAALLVHLGGRSGVQVAAISIMAGVIIEALATWVFAQTTMHSTILSTHSDTSLTQSAIWRFHSPLAASTLLILLSQPLNAAALALLPSPQDTLAAWPVAFSIVFMAGGWVFTMQEVTVALASEPGARRAVARFTWIVGLTVSALLALTAYTPVLHLYLDVLQIPRALEAYVQIGVAICILQPLGTALSAWTRGALIAVGATGDVYKGTGFSFGAQVLVLVITVACGLPGMWVAATANLGATLVELAYLRARATARGAV